MTGKIAGLFAVLCLGGGASAASLTFEGTIGRDDALVQMWFRPGPGEVRIRTWSYAGGGFDPALAVFDPAGLLIGFNQDGAAAEPDPATTYAFDAEIVFPWLPEGRYRAVLSQSQNTPLGPFYGDGFVYAGQHAFTGDISGFPGDRCRDLGGNPRTCQWGVDLDGVDWASQVPEPATGWLILAVLAGFVRGRWTKRPRE